MKPHHRIARRWFAAAALALAACSNHSSPPPPVQKDPEIFGSFLVVDLTLDDTKWPPWIRGVSDVFVAPTGIAAQPPTIDLSTREGVLVTVYGAPPGIAMNDHAVTASTTEVWCGWTWGSLVSRDYGGGWARVFFPDPDGRTKDLPRLEFVLWQQGREQIRLEGRLRRKPTSSG